MNLLIVEDEPSVAERIAEAFEDGDYALKIAGTLLGAEKLLESFWPEFVVLDANFPTKEVGADAEFNAASFLTALTSTRRDRPQPNVILISGDNASAQHFDAIRDWLRTDRISDVLPKSGAWKFLQALLRHRVEMLRQYRFRAEPTGLQKDQDWLRNNAIVSREPVVLKMARDIRNLVDRTGNEWTIFITGPNGSGKGLFARAIHNEMGVTLGDSIPFIVCNCGTIEPSVARALLFGSRKGIYTDAQDLEGYLEQAKNGVLFLDDVHLLPPKVQGALLDALEDRQFRRLGDSKVRRLEARVVVATNADLEALLEKDLISEEFLNRVARLRLTVPSLAKRPLDIEPLARHFAHSVNNDVRDFHPDVINAFQRYPWPGNVRQFKNIIELIRLGTRERTVTMPILESLKLDHAGRTIEWTLPQTLPLGPQCAEDYLLLQFGWSQGWRGLGEGQMDRVMEWLRGLYGPNSGLVDDLDARLKSQTKPKPVHFMKALLFLTVTGGHRAIHRELEDVLCLGWDYVNRVTSFLAGLEYDKVPGFQPPFLRRISEGARYVYLLREDLVALGAPRG